MQPLISIILPAYNAEAHLERAIDSILNQTYKNFELILIDDGSTDKTWNIIEKYTDHRIKKTKLEQNSGLIFALNRGLEESSGDYIARMDADDIALPEKLEKQIQFMESHPDHVACGTAIINFNEKVSAYARYPVTDEEIRANLFLFDRSICHPTVMIRADTIHNNGIKYRCEYIHAEDYQLWIDLAEYGKLHNLEEGLLKYCRHGEQISSKYYGAQIETSESILTELFNKVFRPYCIEHDIHSHLRLLVHPVNRSDLKADQKSMKSWKNTLISTNQKHRIFRADLFEGMVTEKYFRSSLYYNFSTSEKLQAIADLFKISPIFALKVLTSQAKRSLYHGLIKKLA